MDYLPGSLALTVPISVSLSFVVNRIAANSLGEERAALAAPLTEELAKTVPAVLLSCPIVAAHILFGVVESLYDLYRSRRGGAAAALASLVGHAAIGGATSWVVARSGSFALGLAVGIAIHLGWNLAVTGGTRSGS